MQILHKEMARAKAKNDRSVTLQENFDFHFALYESAGMPILLGLLETLWARTGPVLRELYTSPSSTCPASIRTLR